MDDKRDSALEIVNILLDGEINNPKMYEYLQLI
jgi:hypothetical protein